MRGGHAVVRKGREIQKKKVEIPLGQMSGGGFFQRKKLQDLNRAISFILLCKALGAEEVFKKTYIRSTRNVILNNTYYLSYPLIPAIGRIILVT